ncbi:MAG: gliding motility lipoprotein GldH [Pseudoflavonifractor sp.]|nr:gliding motility lipoprotein GldH [Alloprevotella sp.]MCM1117546.1 gliding motility lipoprotein GldH [Pseudoflavonifractor sp.]
MLKILKAAIPALAMLLAACGNAHMPEHVIPSGYSSFSDITGRGWAYSDTITFITDSVGGQLTVAVRHSANYPYRNLWLEVTRPAPTTDATIRDTINLELADRFGLWLGTGIGPTRQVEAKVADNVRLDSGNVITLRHIMRLDTLPGIEQAGIFVIH